MKGVGVTNTKYYLTTRSKARSNPDVFAGVEIPEDPKRVEVLMHGAIEVGESATFVGMDGPPFCLPRLIELSRGPVLGSAGWQATHPGDHFPWHSDGLIAIKVHEDPTSPSAA